jgi:hypothetical protein
MALGFQIDRSAVVEQIEAHIDMYIKRGGPGARNIEVPLEKFAVYSEDVEILRVVEGLYLNPPAINGVEQIPWKKVEFLTSKEKSKEKDGFYFRFKLSID